MSQTSEAGRTVARPFPDDDLLTYEELTPEWRALRALLGVLADTGAAVAFPPALCPDRIALEVASGWRLRWEVGSELGKPDVLLSARWVPAPQPGEGS